VCRVFQEPVGGSGTGVDSVLCHSGVVRCYDLL
jgi:hypothetical protein